MRVQLAAFVGLTETQHVVLVIRLPCVPQSNHAQTFLFWDFIKEALQDSQFKIIHMHLMVGFGAPHKQQVDMVSVLRAILGMEALTSYRCRSRKRHF